MKSITKLFYFLMLPTLLSGCVSSKNNTPKKVGYFKQFENKITEFRREYKFIDLYDSGDNNRFTINFNFDLHFGYSLKITEYALNNKYHYPNEGEFASDYESISFTLMDSDSVLFPSGKYVLKHNLVNSKDAFTLKVNETTFTLSEEEKDPPVHIHSKLVGKFGFKNGTSYLFTLTSTVDERLVSTITLKEDSKEFTTSDLVFSNQKVSFKVLGEDNATCVKINDNSSFYISAENKWYFSNGETDYELEKIEEAKEGYFYQNKVRLSNEHLSVEVISNVGEDRRYFKLFELDAGGKTDMMAVFNISSNGESLVNAQAMNGNLIFTSESTIEFRHHKENNIDKVDLYKNNILLYSDLTIEII